MLVPMVLVLLILLVAKSFGAPAVQLAEADTVAV
jgi:hypothetical protein